MASERPLTKVEPFHVPNPEAARDGNQHYETLPGSLQSLFTGGNTGIRLIQVSPDPD